MGKIREEIKSEYYYAAVNGQFNADILKSGWNKLIRSGAFTDLITASIFRAGEGIVLYIEKIGEVFSVEKVFGFLSGYLHLQYGIGGPSYWRNIPELFSYVPKEDKAHWMRKERCRPRCFFGILRQESISEYLFYHYQLREEGKAEPIMHSSIGLTDRYLFMYDETPRRYTQARYKGKLQTDATPGNWLETMTPLFEKVNGRLWTELELLAEYYKERERTENDRT